MDPESAHPHAPDEIAEADRTEVAIVGGGPIGLELAAALTECGRRSIVIEAGCLGATIAWWAPGTVFFSSPERISIAGVPLESADQSKASRERYLTYLRAVAKQFRPTLRTFTRVRSIERRDGEFLLHTVRSDHGVGGPAEQVPPTGTPSAHRPCRADRVVLAIGDMHRARRLGVPGETLPHVSHYFDDPHVYFGRRVVIVGGKNSAVEAAIRLHRAGVHVTMSYRGAEFDSRRVKYWLRPELEWLIDQGQIAYYPHTDVERIDDDAVHLRTAEGSAVTVPAEAVLLMTGYEQDSTLFEQLGVELTGEARAPRFDPETMETSVPGVHVAGTAVAGTQSRARVFIENSHVHVARILRALGEEAPAWTRSGDRYALLEES